MDEKEVERKGATLIRWGVGFTIAYILVQLGYAYSEWNHLLAMKPEGYANFLAGVFSPLAFLWLVLGFFQQGIELRNSGRALWLQGEELRASVEQSKQLVDVTRDQLAHEKRIAEETAVASARVNQPILRILSGGSATSGNHRWFDFKLVNSGPRCTDLSFELTGNVSSSGTEWFPVLETGGTRELRFAFQGIEVTPFLLTVRFTDSVGRNGFARFQFEVPSPESLTVPTNPIELGFTSGPTPSD